MATPTPPDTGFTLGQVEGAVVVGTGAVSAAILSGQFGDYPVVVKLVAVAVLAADGFFGYRHLTSP